MSMKRVPSITTVGSLQDWLKYERNSANETGEDLDTINPKSLFVWSVKPSWKSQNG